jgi:hypothetical protein
MFTTLDFYKIRALDAQVINGELKKNLAQPQ